MKSRHPDYTRKTAGRPVEQLAGGYGSQAADGKRWRANSSDIEMSKNRTHTGFL